MSNVEIIERLCDIVQTQAEIIKMQSAALEQFGAADAFATKIEKVNVRRRELLGQDNEE